MLASIRAKFLALCLFFVVAMAVGAGFTAVQVMALGGDMAALTRFIAPLQEGLRDVQLRELEQSTLLARYFEKSVGNTIDRPALEGLRIAIDAKHKGIVQSFKLVKGLAAEARAGRTAWPVRNGVMNEIDDTLRQLEAGYRGYIDGVGEVLDLLAVGSTEAARQRELDLRAAARELTNGLRRLILQLSEYHQAAVADAETRERSLIQIGGLLLVFTAAGGVALAAGFSGGLAGPVHRLTEAAQAVQSGRLDTTVPVSNRAEIGRLEEAFNRMTHELKLKKRIKDRFGKHIDPTVVDNLITGESALDSSETRVMTVSVTNLTGFDWLAEHWPPELLREFLNDYLTAMTEPVISQKGIVDNFVSDRVVSFWGPPFCSERNHARRACAAALDQYRRYQNLRHKYAERLQEHEFGLRIGIATGKVVVGSIGTDKSKAYTVVGNCVNYANRLEKANRIYRTGILISEETYKSAADTIAVRDMDKVVLVGTEKPAHLYELLGPANTLSAEREAACALFERAQTAYRKGDFNEAQQLFTRCLDHDPNDFAPQLFLNRMTRLQRRHQDRVWDGIWVVRDPYERHSAES